MTMLSESTFHELGMLAVKLAPELLGAPLHLLNHVDGWVKPDGALAYAFVGPPLGVRDELKRLGKWHGQWGAAIVFASEPESREELLGLFLHELAHVLPARPAIIDDEVEPTVEQRQYQQVQLAAWAARSATADPWAGHGPDWIRRAIHLRYRAQLLGVDVPLKAMNVAGPAYALSMPSNYEIELNHEPAMSTRKTFAEIDAMLMPPRFAKRFADDVREFHLTNLLAEPTND
jgi:hypothetical protein